ncbi:MAG TPA: endolytic transglycosylase MltG [Ktedonobacteraceae bacterium]|nr:endolytic transglycosylase MltG [Ktedonobacteraceae bacterium]
MMKTRGSRIAILSVLLLGLIIFGIVYFAWNTAFDIFQPASSPPGTTVPVRIYPGESTAQIASDLQNKGLIRNALAFRIWARIKGLDTSLQAGGYNHLNTSMTISDIINKLLTAQPDVLYVSIPEGWRIQQIAAQFAAAGLAKFSEKDFLSYTLHPSTFPDFGKYPVLKFIPHGDSMEGLLFPATYPIPVDGDARVVVNQMLTAFDNYVAQYNLVAKAKAHNLNEYQMVILASLVQREINNLQDAGGVASVYWNRIYKPAEGTVGLLQSDPSVEYARDSETNPAKYWTPLNDIGDNIAKNSPWNTYINKGLPPTPICSPGLATLQAAAAPPTTSYYYFLGKPSDGRIVFATTPQEFQQDIQKYLQG